SPPVASDRNDRTRHRCGNVTTSIFFGRGITDAATAGDCGDRRNFDLDGTLADHYPCGALLSKPQTSETFPSPRRNACMIAFFTLLELIQQPRSCFAEAWPRVKQRDRRRQPKLTTNLESLDYL